MLKIRLLFLLVLCWIWAPAQVTISGHVNLDKNTWEQKVYLGKVVFEEDTQSLRRVGWSPITEEGAFSFKSKHISDKDAVYRLYLEKVEKIIKDTISEKTDFIISNKDQISFPNGLSAPYKNSSKADTEWLKFKRVEEDISSANTVTADTKLVEDTITEAYATKLKAYTKDSLKILLVKLIGVQQLAEKGLLERDITKNQEYYLHLLAELQESDMPESEYQFLSRRLSYLTLDVVAQKYQWSRMINIILALLLVVLIFLAYQLKGKQNVVPAHLSKREQNIQALILEGKTNKEIANELFISISTVKTHITKIYSKLNVSGRQELLQKIQN